MKLVRFIIQKERKKNRKLYFFSLVFLFLFRKTFEIKGFKLLIDRIAESKDVKHEDILSKINANEGPSLNHVTETTNKQITDRMTDTTHYT